MSEKISDTKEFIAASENSVKSSDDFATIAKSIDEKAVIKNSNSKSALSSINYLMDNRFHILKLIGKGGMCNVYRAFDTELKRDVAVKVLNDKYRGDTETDILSRFRSEGSTVANLTHPDIIKIYHTCQDPVYGPALILELVEGCNLSDLLKDKTLPAKTAASIALRLALAIDHAHCGKNSMASKPTAAIIHRDLKPGNILISGADQFLETPLDSRFQCKITDFGLGKNLEPNSGNHELTAFGMIVGTPSYMAPEQAKGEKNLTTAVDIYGLGAILYEMLTGKPPFTGPTISAILRQVLETEPIPPFKLVNRIPTDLSAICLKCLEKDPNSRYSSARELADDLEKWLNNKPTKAKLPGTFVKIFRWAKKHPLPALSITGFSALLLSLMALGYFSYHQMIENQQFLHESEKLRFKGKMHETSLNTLNSILDLLNNKDGTLSRTPGLEPLHNILQKFYSRLVEDSKDEKFIDPVKLAEAHLSLSELMNKKGNKTDSALVLENAILLIQDLNTPDSRFQLAKAYLYLGDIQRDLGENIKSLGNLQKALVIFSELSKDNSSDKKQSENAIEMLAQTHHSLGTYHAHLNTALSLENYSMAINLFASQLKLDPGNILKQRNLARSYGYRGDVNMDMENFVAADKDYWDSHHLRENVAALQKINPFWNQEDRNLVTPRVYSSKALDNDKLESLFQLARSFANFGTMHGRINLLSTSEEFFVKSRSIREYIVKASPNVNDFKYDLAGNIVEISLIRLRRIGQTLNNISEHSNELQNIGQDLEYAINDIYEPVIRSDRAIPFLRGQGEAQTVRCQLEWLRNGDPDSKLFRDTEFYLSQKYPDAQYDTYNLAKIYAMRAHLYEKKKPKESDEYSAKALEAIKKCVKTNSGFSRLEEAKKDPVFRKLPILVAFLDARN